MRALGFLFLLLMSNTGWGLHIVTSVEPLAKVMRDLYDDAVQVSPLLTANQNPHHIALSPRQVARLQNADLVVWLGAEAEPAMASLMSRRSKPSLAVLDLPALPLRHATNAHSHAEHAHAQHDHHEHHHDHEQTPDSDIDTNIDPHLWLSPQIMEALANRLATDFPQHLRDGMPTRWQHALRTQLAQWRNALAPLQQTPWISYHQPWGYLSDALGMQAPLVLAEQLNTGPSSRHFLHLAAQVKAQNVQCALQEPEARGALIRRICPSCRIVAADPLGRDMPEMGYLAWLETLQTRFLQCLGSDRV